MDSDPLLSTDPAEKLLQHGIGQQSDHEAADQDQSLNQPEQQAGLGQIMKIALIPAHDDGDKACSFQNKQQEQNEKNVRFFPVQDFTRQPDEWPGIGQGVQITAHLIKLHEKNRTGNQEEFRMDVKDMNIAVSLGADNQRDDCQNQSQEQSDKTYGIKKFRFFG